MKEWNKPNINEIEISTTAVAYLGDPSGDRTDFADGGIDPTEQGECTPHGPMTGGNGGRDNGGRRPGGRGWGSRGGRW